MTEIIEVQNNTKNQIIISAYRSKTSGILYIDIYESNNDNKTEVQPNEYERIKVKEVMF